MTELPIPERARSPHRHSATVAGTFASARTTWMSPIQELKEVVMRLIRQLTYVSTGGVIDIRSDADRIASYSKRLNKQHTTTTRVDCKRRR